MVWMNRNKSKYWIWRSFADHWTVEINSLKNQRPCVKNGKNWIFYKSPHARWTVRLLYPYTEYVASSIGIAIYIGQEHTNLVANTKCLCLKSLMNTCCFCSLRIFRILAAKNIKSQLQRHFIFIWEVVERIIERTNALAGNLKIKKCEFSENLWFSNET